MNLALLRRFLEANPGVSVEIEGDFIVWTPRGPRSWLRRLLDIGRWPGW